MYHEYLLVFGALRLFCSYVSSDITWYRKKDSKNCYFSLSQSDSEKYSYDFFDKTHKRISPVLLSPSLYSIPTQFIILVKCKQMHLTLDGARTFTVNCTNDSELEIPLEDCYDCSRSNCKTSCEVPTFKSSSQQYKIYYAESSISENLSNNASLKSKLIVTCNQGYSMLDGLKKSTSTCQLIDGWTPPVKYCYNDALYSRVNTDYDYNTLMKECILPHYNPTEVKSYSVYDADGNKIETLSRTKVPVNSTIVFECKKGYFLTDGGNTFTATCQSHEYKDYSVITKWQPPLESCYPFNNNSIADPTKQSCILPYLDSDTEEWYVHEKSVLGLAQEPLNSTIVVKCRDMHLMKDASKISISTCHYGPVYGVWKPAIPKCLNCSETKCRTTCHIPSADTKQRYEVHDKYGRKIEKLSEASLGSRITVNCEKRYSRLDGKSQSISTCIFNRDLSHVQSEWKPPLESCFPIASSCELPPDISLIKNNHNDEYTTDKDKNQRYIVLNKSSEAIQVQSLRKIPASSTISVICADSFEMVNGANMSTSFCLKKGKLNPPLELCYKICEPVLPTQHINFESCTRRGQEVECVCPLLAGSSAVANCEEGYYDISSRKTNFVYCGEDGIWVNLPVCTEDCEEIVSPSNSMEIPPEYWYSYDAPNLVTTYNSIHSTMAAPGQNAWHVAIYILGKDPLLICGGTIVSSQVIISAAHCFYDTFKEKLLRNPTKYEIAVAKFTRNYTVMDNRYTRIFKLKGILFPEKEYNPNPTTGNTGSDIVILVPAEPIVFHKNNVFPACLSWNDFPPYMSSDNTFGIWLGSKRKNEYSKTLVFVVIPFISYSDCIKRVKSSHVTQDKFCGGDDLGPGLRIGDSGGGFMFEHSNRMYLRGIVSYRDSGSVSKSSTTSINSFTDISYYMSWIRKINYKLADGSFEFSEMEEEEISEYINARTSTFSTDSVSRDLCELPIQSMRISYTIKTCEEVADDIFCQKQAGDFVNPDVALHIRCMDVVNKSTEFDSYCIEGQWEPPFTHCLGELSRTSTVSLRDSMLPREKLPVIHGGRIVGYVNSDLT